MKKKIDPVKISPTAHLTSHAWGHLGISNSNYFVDKKAKIILDTLRLLGFPFFIKKENDYIYNMLEPRHRLIDYLIFSKFPYFQIIEFASGLSPRGMTFSENPEYLYIESDLPDMLNKKKSIVEDVYNKKGLKKDNHLFLEFNLLEKDNKDKLLSLIDKSKPLIIITEGLTPYFDKEHLKLIFQNIIEILKETGGVYISDIYHKKDVEKNLLSDNLTKIALKILDTTFHLEINDKKEGEEFFYECGFDYIEIMNPFDFSKQLGLKHKISSDKNIATIYVSHVKKSKT